MTQPDPSPKAAATCAQIRRAAEKIFAEKGYRAMTLREVTAEAGVNLAAVNYHFGSKRDLMAAALQSRIEPVNKKRLSRLSERIAQHAPAPVPLGEIFESLFRPIFETARSEDGGACFTKIVGRAIMDPDAFMGSMHRELFSELVKIYIGELQRTCPELSDDEVRFRFYLAVSLMIGVMTDTKRLKNFTSGKFSSDDIDTVVQQLVGFAVAGFETTETPKLK